MGRTKHRSRSGPDNHSFSSMEKKPVQRYGTAHRAIDKAARRDKIKSYGGRSAAGGNENSYSASPFPSGGSRITNLLGNARSQYFFYLKDRHRPSRGDPFGAGRKELVHPERVALLHRATSRKGEELNLSECIKRNTLQLKRINYCILDRTFFISCRAYFLGEPI